MAKWDHDDLRDKSGDRVNSYDLSNPQKPLPTGIALPGAQVFPPFVTNTPRAGESPAEIELRMRSQANIQRRVEAQVTPEWAKVPAEIGKALPPPAMSTQVGGTHYTKMPIQPFEYSMRNRLDPMQHTIIKYVTRFRDKGGLKDLQKARHTIDLLIEHEYGPQNAG
jgi:hypothetical protein